MAYYQIEQIGEKFHVSGITFDGVKVLKIEDSIDRAKRIMTRYKQVDNYHKGEYAIKNNKNTF